MAFPVSLFRSVLLLLFVTIFSASAMEFQVGGTDGWVVPPSNDARIYNDWASENRFQVGDAIRFRYSKDSVMEVEERDYKNCNSSHPVFFSNTGNTIYGLDRSGAFYFISGVSGHCEIGQRMIVKVLTSKEASSASKLAVAPFVFSIFASLLLRH